MIQSAFYVLLVASAIKAASNSYLESVISDLGKRILFSSNSEDELAEPRKVIDASNSYKDVEVETNPNQSIPITNLPDELSDEQIQTLYDNYSIRKMKVLAKGIRHVVDLGLVGSSRQKRSVEKTSKKSGWFDTLKNFVCLCGLLCGTIKGEERQYEDDNVAAYAMQGRREYMEDRFAVKNIENTGVSLFAVFDGHGGNYASEYAAKELIDALKDQVIFLKIALKNTPVKQMDKNLAAYFKQDHDINYEKLLNDIILATDESLMQSAMKIRNIAGTTALVALLDKDQLIVANVGDSRGVMCDGEGNAIPLSFDHKPGEESERKRIEAARGMVIFDEIDKIWRVNDLATSRALGDYPLKKKTLKLVIAKPDIKTFYLSQHKPQFLILATDGLWDEFENKEAVGFVKEKEQFKKPLSAARSIALAAYKKGSYDNITAMIINLSQH